MICVQKSTKSPRTGWPATTDCVRNFGSIVAKLLKIAVFEANDGCRLQLWR